MKSTEVLYKVIDKFINIKAVLHKKMRSTWRVFAVLNFHNLKLWWTEYSFISDNCVASNKTADFYR